MHSSYADDRLQPRTRIHSLSEVFVRERPLQKKNLFIISCCKLSFPKITVLLILLILLAPKINAQQATDFSVQANIIYHFTKYIDWPQDKKSGDFVIGIVGDSPLYGELIKFIVNKTVGQQKIVITKFPASANSFRCQILFISEEESGNLRKIALRTAGAPILLVSESEGLAEKGSCINFIIVSDHLKLEINKTNIEQRNLGIASELLQLAKIIK